MSDERRERYAAAIIEAQSQAYIPYDLTAYHYADAAMAVADAEQQETEDAYMVAAVIRKDLETAREENARLKAEQRGLRENLESAEAEIREQDADIARLRAELSDTKRRATDDLFAKNDEIFRLREGQELLSATIWRVREVLAECGQSESASTIVDEIRAALEGE